jgi:hypothetical protein
VRKGHSFLSFVTKVILAIPCTNVSFTTIYICIYIYIYLISTVPPRMGHPPSMILYINLIIPASAHPSTNLFIYSLTHPSINPPTYGSDRHHGHGTVSHNNETGFPLLSCRLIQSQRAQSYSYGEIRDNDSTPTKLPFFSLI